MKNKLFYWFSFLLELLQLLKKTISEPGILMDTTIGQSRFIMTWKGEGQFIIMDSIKYDTVIHGVINTGYISVNSVYRISVYKKELLPGIHWEG